MVGIEGLSAPRDQHWEFQTQLFAPYQRHTDSLEETEEAVIKMYQSGMSTREIGKFIENAYSPTTISHITDVVKKDIEKWHTRPLQKRRAVTVHRIPNPSLFSIFHISKSYKNTED
jgi:putative transposase